MFWIKIVDDDRNQPRLINLENVLEIRTESKGTVTFLFSNGDIRKTRGELTDIEKTFSGICEVVTLSGWRKT